jgi:transmembrane sensor
MMSRFNDDEPDVARATTSAEWFMRRRNGVSRQEEAQFVNWLQEDSKNRQSYEDVTRAWELVGRSASDPSVAEMRSRALLVQEPQSNRRRPWAAAAAALVLLVGGGAGLRTWYDAGSPRQADSSASPSQLISTTVGERSTTTLEDGSVITLNTDSRVLVSYNDRVRTVSLVTGQAIFKVAKNKLRPFLVYAGQHVVEAVGTEFEVRFERRNLQVAMLEGHVRVGVNAPEGERAHTTGVPRPTLVATLGPGQELAEQAGRVSIQTADVDSLVSWRHGHVRFSSTPLVEAVAEMNRYSIVPIVIDDPSIDDMRVSGTFRTGQSDSFGAALAEAFPVKQIRTPDAIRLSALEKEHKTSSLD